MSIKRFDSAGVFSVLITSSVLLVGQVEPALAQSGEYRWLRVGSLRSWYSNVGSEMELARTGQVTEQNDGLRWPAQFKWGNNCAAKGMWLGTTNYDDRTLKATVAHKVVAVGPRTTDIQTEIMPATFKMIGQYGPPTVSVDGKEASDNSSEDVVDLISDTLRADRMVINELNSYIGVTITRRVLAYSQQNHDNYFIYEYTLKNTGIIDKQGTVEQPRKTLTGVVLFFTYRYALGNEAFKNGWYPSNNIDWGRNAMDQVVGTNPTAPSFTDPNSPTYHIRSNYSWYGRHTLSPSVVNGAPATDVGLPDWPHDGHLAAVHYVGTVTLHADKSAIDRSDNTSQPTTTMYIGNDTGPNTNQQFNPTLMDRKYAAMTAGHAPVTQADQIGNGFADGFGGDAGGYAQGQGYGPYTLAPGDSVRIVIAEAVAGLDRQSCFAIGKKWLDNVPPFTLPGGSTTADRNAYKDAWVRTGIDSLMQTFHRAMKTYQNNYVVVPPPPAPNFLDVNSGGDRVRLTWAVNAESSPGFDGYEVYRAIDQPDTSYTPIFSCNRANVVHTFDDTTALRGRNYYYYVVSKDDGSRNDVSPGVPLVSSKYLTMTNTPAQLKRPANQDLAEIRVVPNPYNRAANAFGTVTRDRLAFYGLPGVCTIKIFTERGDLVQTLNHDDGSGDQLWDSLTSSKQIIVSGLYIAVFQTPDGRSAFRKFIVVR